MSDGVLGGSDKRNDGDLPGTKSNVKYTHDCLQHIGAGYGCNYRRLKLMFRGYSKNAKCYFTILILRDWL